MSSSKWISQCISPEVAYGRRSSLNQLDTLKHLAKLTNSRALKSLRSNSSHRSEVDLLSLSDIGSEDLSVPRDHVDSSGWNASPGFGERENCKSLQLRRASCDPSLMHSVVQVTSSSLLRRSSLAASVGRHGAALLPHEPAAKRRRSFCTSSPLLPSAHEHSFCQKSEYLSHVPSLSPCVEDELKEDKFLFSYSGNVGSPSMSPCSPFLHNINFSNLCRAADKEILERDDGDHDVADNGFGEHAVGVHEYGEHDGRQHEYVTRDHLNVVSNGHVGGEYDNDRNACATCGERSGYVKCPDKLHCSIPVINVNGVNADTWEDDHCLHEGFSLWLINHIRDSPTRECGDLAGRSLHAGESWRGLGRREHRSSWHLAPDSSPSRSGYKYHRRVSLQNCGYASVSVTRKASLHVPRLRPPATRPPDSGMGRGVRCGAVIGRGGFGTVHVGRYKGEYVAVKKIQTSKAFSCWQSERSSLRVRPHPHLVTVIAVLSPSLQPSMATLQLRDDVIADNQAEISLRSLGKLFGLNSSKTEKISGILEPMNEAISSRSSKQSQGNGLLKETAIEPKNTSLSPNHSSRPRTSHETSVEGEIASRAVSSKPSLGSRPLQNTSLKAMAHDNNWLWVVSELCTSATLLSVIHSQAELSIKQKIRFLGELASGLSFLHSQLFVHRDVKPANAFLTYGGAVKLGDYGCCGDMAAPMMPVIGTIAYQAPEILQGSFGSPKSDVYSFGITTWHVLHRTVPYAGLHPHVIAYNVTRIGLRPDTPWPVSVTTPDCAPHQLLLETMLATLARKCWHRDPSRRPSSPALCRTLAILYLTPELGAP